MDTEYPGSVDDVDVVVIGGGPAGATAARSLARRGRTVTLLERRQVPRFHIGESLLPYMMGLLDRLDLLQVMGQQGYVVKTGAEFTDSAGAFRRVNFAAQGPGRYHVTYQVERAHFDHFLLNQAKDAGATVIDGAAVTELLVEDGRVCGVAYTSGGRTRSLRARFVVDAAGRTGKAAATFGLRRPLEHLRMVAVYRHFTGLDESRNPGVEGDIQIGSHPDGWVWAIPIWSDVISVGTVMSKKYLHGRDPVETFADHVARIPRIAQRIEGTEPLGEVRVETDYCYYSDTVAGDGWVMVGDAGCFIDPIFSGGVYLAMVTGDKAAEAVDALLTDPAVTREVLDTYERFYKTGYDTYARLIQAFYECNFNFPKYVASLPATLERKWMARLLSGDFWSAHNPLNRILRQESRWDVFAPFEPVYGCPVYPALDVPNEPATTDGPENMPIGAVLQSQGSSG